MGKGNKKNEKKKSFETQKMTDKQIKKSDLEVQGLASLSKDVKESVVNINSRDELRFLVDSYYQTQNYRIAVEGQIRAIKQGYDTSQDQEVPSALQWVAENVRNQEKQIQKMLDLYTDNSAVGQWCKDIIGIGPTITAGLLAYFDISKCQHFNQFHSYAGLNDNNIPWLGAVKAKNITETAIKNVVGEEAAKKYKPSTELSDEIITEISMITFRKYGSITKNAKNDNDKITKESMIKYLSMVPYNLELKKLCWKIGESFVKVSGKEDSLYGRMYKERKAYETAKNEELAYKEQAERILRENNIGKSTEAYKYYSVGKLPPAHINARAKRWAVKLFISHLFEAMYMDYYGTEAPVVFSIAHQDHVDYIGPEVPFDRYISISIK